MSVTRIAQIGHSLPTLVDAVKDCEVAIAPEVREWDCVEYVRDALALGERKGLILIAHERGEQLGVARCAAWLRSVVHDIPVQLVASREPFVTLANLRS